MKFTKEEIERYYSGKASTQEQKAIDDWLTQKEEELVPLSFEADRFNSDWEKLAKSTFSAERRSYTSPLFRGLAASIVVLLTTWAYFLCNQENTQAHYVALINTSKHHHLSKKLEGISVAVFPSSNAYLSFNRPSGDGKLRIDEAVMIQNKRNRDLSMIVEDRAGKTGPQTFICKKGKTYSIFLDKDYHTGQFEIHVIEEHRFSKNHSFDITAALYSQMVWFTMAKKNKLMNIFI